MPESMSLEQKITESWYGEAEAPGWLKLLKPLNHLYRFGLEQKRKKAAKSRF